MLDKPEVEHDVEMLSDDALQGIDKLSSTWSTPPAPKRQAARGRWMYWSLE